ncbi:prepilin peptidase [Nitrosomonas sp. Nm34]|uniref:A24 family peptidase n=1 Tax=Nitrosomonas sp. Nm34 TaxID=1881055 RepID=UPI0008E5AF14|nr:prepilin peptidase [Nitrosomonas sp. Nm34]SFI27397.1 prepilin peptidase CpaA [Nitrosomonas sp. Nm34]
MYSLIIGTLIIFLLIAAWQDIHHYRIPNVLVFPGAIIGLLLNTLLPQEMGAFGFLTSLAGLGLGLMVLFPLYLLRAMGAGDIKLMAMIGAFVGPINMLSITLYILLAGGVLALSVVLLRRNLSKLLENLKIVLLMRLAGLSMVNMYANGMFPESAGKLPYGVAIAAGTLFYLAATN